MIKVTITLKQLTELGACEHDKAIFKKSFGKSVSFDTLEEAIDTAKAMSSKLDFGWASENLLREDNRAVYEEAKAPLGAAYEEATAPLRAAYEEARAPLLAAYREAKAPLGAAYREAIATLLAAYEEAKAPLLAAYEEAIATLLAAYEEAKAPLLAAYEEAIAVTFTELYWEQESDKV